MSTPRVANISTFPAESYPESRLLRIDRSGLWGNPYRIGMTFDDAGSHYRSRTQSLELYEELMRARLRGQPGPQLGRHNPETGRRWSHKIENGAQSCEERDAEIELWLRRLRMLSDKILLCWCHPLPCHGHILARLYDELPELTAWQRDRVRNRHNKRKWKELREAQTP